MRIFKNSIPVMVAAIALGSLSTAAQTPSTTPKPLATPPRVVSGAEIISRADELFIPPVQNPEDVNARPDAESAELRELRERIKRLEAGREPQSELKKADPDEVQKRMLLNLDILTRAEQRSESLRKQLFEMIEKENTVRSRMEQLEFEMRPEMIERSLQLAGSMRPEEVRENRKKSLIAERTNLQALLNEIQTTRTRVAASLQGSEVLVEKLRAKLEKDIDDALLGSDK